MLNLLVTIRSEDKKLHDNKMSGVWQAYKVETIENQRKATLPMNDISATIFYNQRMVISAPIPEPVCWRVTKVEDVSPYGIRRLSFAQDIWDQHHDYIEKDENNRVVGMWADYFQSAATPDNILEEETSLISSITSKITASGNNTQLRIGGSKTFTVNFYEENQLVEHTPGRWQFLIDGADASDVLTVTYPAANKAKVKFRGDDQYIGKILSVRNVTDEGVESSMDVAIIAL